MKNRPWFVYVILALATSSWGSAFIAGNFATRDFDPITVAFLRFLFAAIILLPLMWWLEPNRVKPKGKEWLLLASLGLTGIALYNICFFIATKEAPIVKSSLFIASNPVLIILLSALFLKEKITSRNIIGLILALTGATVIITEGNFMAVILAGLSPIDLVLLIAVICWALYSVLGKVALQRFSPLVSTTYAVVFGTIMLFPFAVAEGSWSQYVEATPLTWMSILHMSVIVSVVSFIMYYQGIRTIGAAKASIFINLMPLSAVILAVLLLGEPILPVHIVGAVLVLTGVTIGTGARLRKKAPVLAVEK
ncbi:drug/metabolite transporter (DMT)-like permease [Evansella vedderi]|uniref:Drug/metabolite transporter (DMT)-like permease n=1 Tax=Evansella vedderi TaxID=38282 RepID=A0ABU0A2Q8_9BACI|nr:DMT family transporter [Evansella vedderi]MDQ0257540.1 drug/metabolite transporter (DMT)-like permease [Evansella vedderi]